jgi:DNA replication protein DnaC/transposase
MGRDKLTTFRALALRQGWLEADAELPEDAALAGALGASRRARSTISTVEPYRAVVQQWLDAGVGGKAIHGALCRQHGYTGSYSSVARMLVALRGARPAEVTVRLAFEPGQAAQVDFGAGPVLIHPDGQPRRTWAFVMTLCHSRHQYVEFVWDQSVPTWLGCHRRAFEWFAAVPRRLIIDNAKCAITRACAKDPLVQRAYAECAEGYGFKIEACAPHDPQKAVAGRPHRRAAARRAGRHRAGQALRRPAPGGCLRPRAGARLAVLPHRQDHPSHRRRPPRHATGAHPERLCQCALHARRRQPVRPGSPAARPAALTAKENVMNPAPELAPQLKQLRLSGILDSLEARNRQAIDAKLAYTEFLALLIGDEVARREHKKFSLRLRRAQFRTTKTLEQFDFERLPQLNRAVVADLATGRYLQEKAPVLIVGPCGTGKSHLAQALGHCAVRQGVDVVFTTCASLTQSLNAARATAAYERKLAALARVPLLIVDDFGLKPLRPPADEDLHDLIAERYEQAATIVTSNLDFTEWDQAFPANRLLASATLDRLRHNAYCMVLDGQSYRAPRMGPAAAKARSAVANATKPSHP